VELRVIGEQLAPAHPILLVDNAEVASLQLRDLGTITKLSHLLPNVAQLVSKLPDRSLQLLDRRLRRDTPPSAANSRQNGGDAPLLV
jgi:hypothetical protein